MISRDEAREFLRDFLAAPPPRRSAGGDEAFDTIVVLLATRAPEVEDRASFLRWLDRHEFYKVRVPA